MDGSVGPVFSEEEAPSEGTADDSFLYTGRGGFSNVGRHPPSSAARGRLLPIGSVGSGAGTIDEEAREAGTTPAPPCNRNVVRREWDIAVLIRPVAGGAGGKGVEGTLTFPTPTG